MDSPPPYTKKETERRWLVPDGTDLKAGFSRLRKIEDSYITGTRLRLRRVTEEGAEPIYKLGKKYESSHAGSHSVVTTYLTASEYQVLAQLPAARAQKTRLSVLGGALDIYEQPNSGLQVFEVEFPSLEAAAEYQSPQGLGQEVTHDPRFTGHALAGAA